MARSSRLKRKLAMEIAGIQDAAINKTGSNRGFSNLASNTMHDAPPSMRKMAEVGGLTPATTRMAPSIWNPMLQITSMVLPRSIEEKNQWRRWYYQHDPIVGTAIDLHTRFPISQFRLRCDNDANGSIGEEYKEIAEDINLFKFFLSMGREFWVAGEAFPFGIWNEDDNKWDSFILMNPDYLDVQLNPYAQRDPVISITKWSQQMKQIVSNGPNHGRTGYIYRHLAETAKDILSAIQLNLPYNLSPMAISHVANKASYFDVRGTSIIDRIFKILMYQDKLQVAQMAGAERYTTPVELWTAGNDESPADDDVLDQLEQIIRDSWTSPQKAVIWNHTLHGEMLGGSGSLLALPPEFEYIDKQKYAALMMNESVLTNNGPTYASASVAMDYMVSWYSTYRQEMEDWALNNVFEPIARAREYYTITKKELVGGYRDKTAQRKPILPKIVWDKANLRDDYQKLQTMIQLAGENKVPWRIVYEMVNMDFDSVLEELEKEAKSFQKLNAIYAEAAATMPGAAGGGAMGAMGGGMGELGGAPIEDGGLEGMPPPEMGPGSPGGEVMPPESVGAAPGAGPSGMA